MVEKGVVPSEVSDLKFGEPHNTSILKASPYKSYNGTLFAVHALVIEAVKINFVRLLTNERARLLNLPGPAPPN